METTAKIEQINFNKSPYKGTFATVHKKFKNKYNKDVSKVTIFQRFQRREPVVTEMVIEEIERREKIKSKADNLVNGAEL